MKFSNPVVGGGGKLIRQAIASPDYEAGVRGWTINKDGSAEFNDITVRGDVVASSFATDVPDNRRIEINSVDLGTIRFYDNAVATLADDFAYIEAETSNVGPSISYHTFTLGSPPLQPWIVAPTIQMVSSSGGPGYITLDPGFDSSLGQPGDIRLDGDVKNTAVRYFGISQTYGTPLLESSWGFTGDAAGNYEPTALIGTTTVARFEEQQTKVPTASSVAAPSYSFLDDPSSGLYRVFGKIGLTLGGVEMIALEQTGATRLIKTPNIRQYSAGGLVVEYNFSNNEIYAQTSSEKLKADLAPRSVEDALTLLDVPIQTWTALVEQDEGPPAVLDSEQHETSRGQTWDRPGWTAEDMARIHPHAAIIDRDGTPIGVDVQVVLADLTAIVAELYHQGTPNQKRSK